MTSDSSTAGFRHRLESFRDRVDLSAVTPDSGAPAWLKGLSEEAKNDLGVFALLGPGGISIAAQDGEQDRASRMYPDSAALLLLALAGAVGRKGATVAVSVPPIGRHLPLLLVGAGALAATINRQLGQKSAGRGILLVSSDLDVRSRYCDLKVRAHRLEEVEPGSRLRPTGDRVALSGSSVSEASTGVCFYLPRGPLPARLEYRPSLVLLDLRYSRIPQARVTELLAWVKRIRGDAAVLVLLTLGDADTESQLRKERVAVFSLDHRGIQTSADFMSSDRATADRDGLEISTEVAPTFLERKHTIVAVPGAEQIESLFANIGKVLDENRSAEGGDWNRARWLMATMSQLPTPLLWYEQAAYGAGRHTLRRMIERIGFLSRHDRAGATLQTLRVQFEMLYRHMELLNPRASAFATLLPQLVQDGSEVLVLVRDKTTQRAVRTWIDVQEFAGHDWITNVEVLSCGDYAKHACVRFPKAVVSGVLPRRYKWIAGGALADDVQFLVYSSEIEIVRSQLNRFYHRESLDKNADERLRVLSDVLGKRVSASQCGAESEIPQLRLVLPQIVGPPKKPAKPKSLPGGLGDLKRAIAEMEKQKAADMAAADLAREHSWRSEDPDVAPEDFFDVDLSETGELAACRVSVQSSRNGPGYLWLPVDEEIECVSPENPSELLLLRPHELSVGHVLWRLEEEGRLGLFDRIVELAEGQPELAYLARFRSEWRVALDRLAFQHSTPSGTDYSAILRKLQGHGAPIQTELTVQNWIRNVVIGPDHVESIAAVGAVSGVSAIAHSPRDFDRAFRRIRSLHQGIGRRLMGAIRRHFKHFAAGAVSPNDETIFDPRLGVPLDELLETVEFLEVVRVSSTSSQISVSDVNRFFK